MVPSTLIVPGQSFNFVIVIMLRRNHVHFSLLHLFSFLVLLPCEILEQAEEEINHPRFTEMCGHSVHGQKFLHEFMDFIQLIASRASQERVLQGLDDGYNYQGFKDNGRVFQLDRAPVMDTKKMKQLPVWIEEKEDSYDHCLSLSFL